MSTGQQMKPATSSAPVRPVSFVRPSLWRAWVARVGLSCWRQTRARQMVWIALGLMAFAVALVAINTAAGNWGMSRWRADRRVNRTYVQRIGDVQVVCGAFHRTAGAHAVQHAV